MSYCSRSSRRRFTVLNFKGWGFSRIYGHFQQHLYCACAESYLWTSGINLDTAVRFADPDFLLECKILEIWRRLHFIRWMSAIFLLPVCLTCWRRKYTTRVDPHADNSHPVWGWFDHTSYSVFVCRYVTWPCDLDLWPFDLEQFTYTASHVTILDTK